MAGARQLKRVGTAELPKGLRILVVEARFYDKIADELLAGACEVLDRAGCRTTILTVPGALEIPPAIAIALDKASRARRPFAGVLALGCVIRGETFHFEIVASESSRALMDIGVLRKTPVGNGILTVNTMDQAWVRASRREMNKGAAAAEATLALVKIALNSFAGGSG